MRRSGSILVKRDDVPMLKPMIPPPGNYFEEDMEILQFIMTESFNVSMQSLTIEITGVGSRYDWLEIFRTIVGIIFGILAALGLESLIRIFRGKK